MKVRFTRCGVDLHSPRYFTTALPSTEPFSAQKFRSFTAAAALGSAHARRTQEVRYDAVSEGLRNSKPVAKRKGARSNAAALEAKRTRQTGHAKLAQQTRGLKNVVAYCTAEAFLIDRVARILRNAGFVLDPFQTKLYPQVIHFQTQAASDSRAGQSMQDEARIQRMGDVFIFPTGVICTWDVEDSRIQSLVSEVLQDAAVKPHLDRIETESLDYFEDSTKEKCAVVGDTLRIRIKVGESLAATVSDRQKVEPTEKDSLSEEIRPPQESHELDLTLSKIAFSSALARSTKLAVLESLLDSYFASTEALPLILSAGTRLPRQYSRRFILRKTGELLSVRAQLNLTELTDRTPDLFWDTRHELGLEGYFEQVSRALDLIHRIRVLNERVDYAREIAEVLREELQSRHGELLEWLIIGLIAVEVGFEGWNLLKDQREDETTEQLTRRFLKKKLSETDD